MPYVPIEWLREHVDVPTGLSAEQLAADLVRVGLEEERIVPPAVTGPLVVGKVLTREAKEQSNGKVINYCRVDVSPPPPVTPPMPPIFCEVFSSPSMNTGGI